jgi:hypothetical protein
LRCAFVECGVSGASFNYGVLDQAIGANMEEQRRCSLLTCGSGAQWVIPSARVTEVETPRDPHWSDYRL